MRSAALLLCFVVACGGAETAVGPPPCGSGTAPDTALDRRAVQFDRQFHALNATATGLTADLTLPSTATAAQDLLRTFLREGSGYELPGLVSEAVTGWHKSAGLYGGVGVVADAMRYATLRDEGAACETIDIARSQLLAGLEAMNRAVVITGAPGVIARGIARRARPGDGAAVTLTPLFDDSGNPLPEEKNNGTWRADQSGALSEWVWEDSASRDMVVGWAMAFAVASEVATGDPTIPDLHKTQLKDNATAIALRLMQVGPRGYDLEIPDADGRTTFHGYLHEESFERSYLPGFENGFAAVMALGIVGGFAQAAQNPEITRYLNDELVAARGLGDIALREVNITNLGVGANHSAFNMVFTAIWIAIRYVPSARTALRLALREELYTPADKEFKPSEMGQALFDAIVATVFDDADARGRSLDTLGQFPEPPYQGYARENCDQQEIAAGRCTLDDGSVIDLHPMPGRGDKLVSRTALPLRTRPTSNYYWRSNPYQVNGGGSPSSLYSGVDFRIAYWMNRFDARPPR